MKHKNARKSLLLLAITAIMLFAVSITASAASSVGTVTQTSTSTSSARIEWTQDVTAYGYNVYYSVDGKTYERIGTSNYTTVSTSQSLSNLSSGTTYYVYVVPVTRSSYPYTYTEQTAKASAVAKVVTAPAAVTSSTIKQTAASSSSVTLSWGGVKGATGYRVLDSKGNIIKTVTKTSAKVKADAGSYEMYKIQSIRTSGSYTAVGGYGVFSAKAAPGKVTSLRAIRWDSATKVTVGWNKNKNDEYTADGYKVEVYSINGKKKIKTYYVTNGYTNSKKFSRKEIKNKGFKVKVTGYIKIGNKKYYGKSTGMKTVVPYADISKTYYRTSKTSIKISWSKVSNATGYAIYVCKNTSTKNFTKVASVGKNTKSYTIKNLKTGKYAGVYVVPTVKVNGKKVKAQADVIMYKTTYISTYY